MKLQITLRAFGHGIVAFFEALLKCGLIFVIQLLAVYPLVAVGQGREAMQALFDFSPFNSSWLIFSLSHFYSSILNAFFLFFLLNRWNYPADDGIRAFFRIWIPSAFIMIVTLLWPIAAELDSKTPNLLIDATGLINGSAVFIWLGYIWWQTKPTLKKRVILLIATAGLVQLVAFIFAPPIVFYSLYFINLAVLCVLIREDFKDNNPNFRPWEKIHGVGLAFAVIYGGGIALLSTVSVPLWMLFGTPGIVLCGFMFGVSLAFLLTILLSLVSRIIVRLGWITLAFVLLFAPINHEPLRLLPAGPGLPERLPPSRHFIEWLRARPEVLKGTESYPVFFIAAQGGGIRAAYWTATLLAGLEERYPGFTGHVYVISGVSGGSVGAAVFTSMFADLPVRGDKRCGPLVPDGLYGFRACSAHVLQWDLLGPPLSGFLLNDLPFGWFRVRRANDLEQGLEYAWFIGMENRRFEKPFQDLWRDRPYHVPSLVLNTTSADTGRRMVVSNLPAKGQITDEPDVETLVGRPVRLSTAAFLSARFPVISPAATIDSPDQGTFRLVDGGYFNNSGMASVVQLLRSILPVVASSEFAGKIRPIVLTLSSSPDLQDVGPDKFSGSLAGALLSPVSILGKTGGAHEATYLKEARDLVGDKGVVGDLKPPKGSPDVALGWMLSAETRCQMDRTINIVLNKSDGSASIGGFLKMGTTQPATWTSCPPPANPK
ncbi:MAG: patatin-like phospholipase family protein [Deltaproteobacteria bacterium]|nr:patatin-like phospholipase family protein [Deltaproteobacteria bacterium]